MTAQSPTLRFMQHNLALCRASIMSRPARIWSKCVSADKAYRVKRKRNIVEEDDDSYTSTYALQKDTLWSHMGHVPPEIALYPAPCEQQHSHNMKLDIGSRLNKVKRNVRDVCHRVGVRFERRGSTERSSLRGQRKA